MTSLIVSHSRSKDSDGARVAFAELRQRSLQTDIVSYTALAACHAGPGAWTQLQAIFTDVRKEGLKPHSLFYNELLRAALDAGSLQHFNETLAEMDAAGIARSFTTENLLKRAAGLSREVAGDLRGSADSPLPPGWQETLDPSSGRRYYWQPSDPAASTTWERPQSNCGAAG